MSELEQIISFARSSPLLGIKGLLCSKVELPESLAGLFAKTSIALNGAKPPRPVTITADERKKLQQISLAFEREAPNSGVACDLRVLLRSPLVTVK